MTGGIAVVKIELPLDLYGKLARSTNGEVGRLLRTLATRAARMESEEIKSIASPTTQKRGPSAAEQRDERMRQRDERMRQRVKFIETEINKGRRASDIARDLGVTDAAVHQQMKRHGIKGVSRSERASALRAERESAVRELWLLHHSGAEIARQLDLHHQVIYPIIRKLKQEDKIA